MVLVDQLVAHWAGTCPDQCALVDGDQRLSYAELVSRAEEQAQRLAAVGLGHGDRVAIVMERSADLVSMELACLHVGAAYVPIPPSQPAKRTRIMLDDCGARAIVRSSTPGMPAIELRPARTTPQHRAPAARGDGDIAYIMYTSGSTGAPRGVAIPHRAIVGLVTVRDYAAIGADDVVAFASNPAFDASTWEVWGALANGATSVVVDRDTAVSPSRLAEAIRLHGITAMFLTTALFNHIVRSDPSSLRGLETLLFGGERCDPATVQRACSAGAVRRLVHVYGPTECTTFALFHEVGTLRPEDVTEGGATVPIGRPITGTTAHVLDPHGHPVADGVEGELYLGGNRLALGYVDDAPLTARRFVPDHIFPGDNRRLYRTGDLAIRRPCGAIDFVGRADRQVKVRGFRIQLEELERTALGHPAVRSAVAYVRPSVDGSELGLVVESDALDEPGVRTHLGLHLPPESVPARIAVVAALPLNQNGKVDRAALNAQEPSGDHEHGKNRAEAADIDPAIMGAWRSALATTTCDPDDDFFDLGGSSLQAARMLAEVRTATGVDLPLTAVFECPTLRSLAAAVTAQRGAATPAVQQPIFSLRAGHAPPLIVVDCYEGTAFTYRPLLRHLQSGAAVVALNAMRVAGRWRLGESVAVIADACIRQLDNAGIAATPPVLVGSSSGGAVAFEMARRLLERGSRIAGVVLLDPASALPMNAALPPTVAMQKFLTSRSRFHRTWQVSKRAFQRFAHSQGERLWFFYDRLSRARSIEERSRLNIARQRVLMAKYWPQPLPAQAPVLFIACTGDRTDTMLERYMNGWSPLLGGAEQMHRVSGRHAQDDAFLAEPHVGEVARLLGAFLTGLQRR